MQRFRVEFGVLTLLLGMASTSFAADHTGVISGVIRDAQGVPQMGALVQVLAQDASVRGTAYTDLQGRYLVPSLLPGIYGVRASAAMFLPASRGKLLLGPDRRAVVNLTLSGLFDQLTWLPAKAKGADEASDDWSWTLRSSANRPILKWADGDGDGDGGQRGARAERGTARATRVKAEMTSPSKEFGRGATGLGLQVESESDGDDAGLILHAAVREGVLPGGLGAGEQGDGPLRVSSEMAREMGPGGMVATRVSYEAHPEILDGVAGYGTAGYGAAGPGMRVVTVSSAERFALGDFAEIEAGSRMEAVAGAASVVESQPFVRVSAHPRADWTVSYSLATSPDVQDFASAMAEDADLPTVAVLGGRARAEAGVHQEVAVSHRSRATLLAVALYADALDRVALSGGEGGLAAGEVAGVPLDLTGMPVDQSNGAFRYLTRGYGNTGVHILVSQRVGQRAWVAVQYCSGAAMAEAAAGGSSKGGAGMQTAAFAARRGESATVSLKAEVARTGTRARATYRWQPGVLLTAIDPYDVLAGGQYLSVHVRQRVASAGILPRGTELTIDATNLLGQGYQGFPGRNGDPLFLASSPQSLQGGILFSF